MIYLFWSHNYKHFMMLFMTLHATLGARIFTLHLMTLFTVNAHLG